MASIIDSINKARQMGASSDQIVGEIIKNNPAKAKTFEQARSMGATSDQILAEITKQNTPQGASFLQGGTSIGAVKGALSTLARPFQNIGQVIGAATLALTGDAEANIKAAETQNQLMQQALKLPADNPKRAELIRKLAEGSEAIAQRSREMVSEKQKFAEKSQDVGGVQEKLKPVGTAENIGFGLERIAEFLVPAAAISKVEKAVGAGIKDIGLGVKVAKFDEVLKGGLRLSGAKVTQSLGGKIAEKTLQTAANSLIGGVTFGAQMLTQGATPEETKDAAILGAILPPAGAALGLAGKGVAAATKPVTEKLAVRVVNSLIKPLLRDFAYTKNPGRAVTKLGIVANSFPELSAKVKTHLQQTGQSIGDLVNTLPELRIDLTKSLNYLDEAAQQAVATNNQTLLRRLSEVKQAITDTLGLEEGVIVSTGSRDLKNMTIQDATKLKTLVGDLAKWTGNVTDDSIVNKAIKQTYGTIKESVETMVGQYDEATLKKLKELNETYGDLLSADKAITYRDKLIQRQDMISLKGHLGAAGAIISVLASGGTAIPAVLAGLGGAALDKALASTAVKTRVARWLMLASSDEKKMIFSKVPMLRGAIERLFGGKIGPQEASPLPKVSKTVTKAGKYVEDYVKNPKVGLGIEDVSKKKISKTEQLADNAEATKVQAQMSEKEKDQLFRDITSVGGNELPVYKGSKSLTLKTLNKLKGKSVTSKQEILDLSNAGDIKQAERNAIRTALEGYGDKVPVKEFANKVETELLPLKRMTGEQAEKTSGFGPKYESITLPDELRGPVANYNEHIYQSPIKTSAGDVHFQNSRNPVQNYFAHTRIEDLPAVNAKGNVMNPEGAFARKGGDTRRVIELQSDLFQKGRLEGEQNSVYNGNFSANISSAENAEYTKLRALEDKYRYDSPDKAKLAEVEKKMRVIQEKGEAARQQKQLARKTELSKLEPYRNTWHERVIREEIKQAAKDGKTKLQFPTGETAMKIEGLGQGDVNRWTTPANTTIPLKTEQLKIGAEIMEDGSHDSRWIITDVLGDGKFKAVPRSSLELMEDQLIKFGSSPDDAINALASGDKEARKIIAGDVDNETFDISGKVDTNNPIYRFYEKDVQKYLNKFGGKKIVDPQGVSWIEVFIKKEQAKMPIEAFGVVPLAIPKKEKKDKK